MKLPIIAIAVATLAMSDRLTHETSAVRRQTNPCLGPDIFTADFVADLKRVLSPASTDSFDLAFQTTTKLTATPDSTIRVVTDSSTCARALTVYNANVSVPTPAPTQVYLIRAGVLYVATTPLPPGAERTNNLVIDSTFALVGGFVR